MRVMLIEKLLDQAINADIPTPIMEIGDEFEVTGVYEYGDRVYYFLSKFGKGMAFRSVCFATLPDTPAEVIEETEPSYATA